MKIRFNRLLSVLCAVMLLTGAFSAWAAADNTPATPTDLTPVEENGSGDEAVAGVEVLITKALTMGESWDGRMKKTKPAVLKLDLNRPCSVYMLVEGRDVWATVEKSDRPGENPERTETDPDTGIMIVNWEAEAGSYLITLGPVEPNLLARAKVTFMDKNAYEAWEAGRAEQEPEPQPEPEPEPEAEPEAEPEEENKPESETAPERHITVDVTWDVPNPVIGDTAHFRATLEGYDKLQYTMQWQYSPDDSTWHDIPGETGTTMDVVVNEENNVVWWRLLVYIEEDQQE